MHVCMYVCMCVCACGERLDISYTYSSDDIIVSDSSCERVESCMGRSVTDWLIII
jgi:hypothetical protein